MPDSSPIIEIENVSKKYRLGILNSGTLKEDLLRWWSKNVNAGENPALHEDEILALNKVNLSIKKGEVLGIIGKNGAGKSTLLKVLSRITAPTVGTIRIKGKTASLLEVGTGFHPELSGRENIFLNGAIMGMTKAEIKERFTDIVEFSGVDTFIDTPVKRYSSGMYVRLAFAVAAHLNPDILIVDEVLAVGDQSFQEKCIGKMQSVSQEGRTVLFVSHNLHMVKKLCQSAVLLEKGEIVFRGSTDQVIEDYLKKSEPFNTETLLPMNSSIEGMVGKRLAFQNSKGDPSFRFNLFEPWKVKLEFDLLQNFPHVIASIGLKTHSGAAITSYWSKPEDLSEGTYFVEFDIDLKLAAGSYTFVVGLSSRDNTLYYVENTGNIKISEISHGEQPVYFPSGSGFLLSSSRPKIQEFGGRNV